MTPAQLASFRRNGFLVLRSLLPPPLMRETARHADWLRRRHRSVRPEYLARDIVLLGDPFWHRLAAHPALLGLAKALVGPDLALFGAALFFKPARTGKAIDWHQEASTWCWEISPVRAANLWIAVDASGPANGGLEFAAGSHREGLRQGPKAAARGRRVKVSAPAGSVVLIDPFVLHRSGPNRSASRRIGLSLDYIATSTRVLPSRRVPVFLMGGRARPGVNRYSRAPRFRPGVHPPAAAV